ncbi:hypothetical protein C2845_PM08G28610 [Panicum miliaceum]|uniref:Xylanase inhibitor C-terminal domain-containing protein n=1 Tax=Panicum miliaceum TaxID=4540 RepID=A0A3L6QYT0_PANMI|nr:hypothetical protein C2845_PM08G28610 [Panicum miliaceum]
MSPLRDSTLTTWDLFKEEIQLASSHVRADALASEKMVVPSHFRRGLYLVPLRIGGSLDRISSREYNTGILALGTSSLSFLAQVRVDKFPYCVPAPARRYDDDQALSYLRFGSQARISGKRIPFWNDKYYVHLKRVTYQHGNRSSQQQPVPIYPGDGGPEGSTFEMLVDSGTLGIWLPESIFYPLQKKIDTDISLIRVHFDVNPNNGCCYIGTMEDVEEVSVTLGFVGGAEMELFGDSLFFEYNDSEWICLGLTPSNTTVLGIYAQRNTNMGFDSSI